MTTYLQEIFAAAVWWLTKLYMKNAYRVMITHIWILMDVGFALLIFVNNITICAAFEIIKEQMSMVFDFFKKFDVKFPRALRISGLALAAFFVLVAGINMWRSEDLKKEAGMANVYLNEEARFADEIYVRVERMEVYKEKEDYRLLLGIGIEQRHTDFWVNKVEIAPKTFQLKSLAHQAKSKMEVFFFALFKETMNILLSGGIEGSINVIEEAGAFALDYFSDSIENEYAYSNKLNPINCVDGAFEPFYPYQVDGTTHVDISFMVTEPYLNSENTIVLAIDDSRHLEKKIFLVPRPAAYAKH